jgi:hyaluronan synthase
VPRVTPTAADAGGAGALADRPDVPMTTPEAAAYPWDVPNEGRLHHSIRWAAALVTAGLCGLLIVHIVGLLGDAGLGTVTGIYTMVIAGYIFSRFLLAAIYKPPRDAGLEPRIAIVVPAFNEGNAVVRTIDACCRIAYPPEKVELVAINDGSTDDTWAQMNLAAARYPGRVTCIDLGHNQGKRAAMAAGIRATDAEILVFVDSDSMPAPWAVRKLVQGFADPKVGAICGLTYIRNANANVLTHMQAASYYVSFQLLKAAESVVNAVSCASGCFAAYRRSAVTPILENWEHQTLLGRPWSHGDDRALTNMVLRRWKVIYDSEAEVWTEAPQRYHNFFKQQLRWQKSFVGESLVLVRHSWRSHPLAFPAILIAAIAGIASPLVTLYQIGWEPIAYGTSPVFYLLGLYVMYTSYALLYRSLRNDGVWKYAVVSAFFYVSFSLQVFWAVIRIHDNRWGTRAARRPAAGLVGARLEEQPRVAAAPLGTCEAFQVRKTSGIERPGKAADSRNGLRAPRRAGRKALLLATCPALIAVAVGVGVIVTRPPTTAPLSASAGQESARPLVPASPATPRRLPSRPEAVEVRPLALTAKRAVAASAPKPKVGQGAGARSDRSVARQPVSSSGTRGRVAPTSPRPVTVDVVRVDTPSDSAPTRSTVPAVHGGSPVASVPSTGGSPGRLGGGTSGGTPGAAGQHGNPSHGSVGSSSGGGTGVSAATAGGQGSGTSSGGG